MMIVHALTLSGSTLVCRTQQLAPCGEPWLHLSSLARRGTVDVRVWDLYATGVRMGVTKYRGQVLASASSGAAVAIGQEDGTVKLFRIEPLRPVTRNPP
jgi:hypothetical protein